MRSPIQSSFQRIFADALFFSITIIVAVIGYILAGWTLLNAVYMVVITIFGVGYGEVKPLDTPGLRIFTIFVIIAGALSVAYVVAGFVRAVTAGKIRRNPSHQANDSNERAICPEKSTTRSRTANPLNGYRIASILTNEAIGLLLSSYI